ncbi:hypothetical protein CPB86DRAFT_814297 [Serendipita vermifera]|nr:hypothetical protein CPB86DRAFT_814297 [Serendipita vermifera]
MTQELGRVVHVMSTAPSATESEVSPESPMLILTPRNNPHFIHEFLLRHIPIASPLGPNTLSNNDMRSPLCYTLATTPESTHPWIIFKFVQEDALKASAGVNRCSYSDPYAFPPSPFLAESSKTIVGVWKNLEPSDIAEWEELARDVRNACSTFDGRRWEEQRSYHARTLYFKWMGYQATYGNASQ